MSLFKEKMELKIEEAEAGVQRAFSTTHPLFKWALGLIFLCLLPSYFIAKSLSLKYWQAKYKAYEIQAKPSFTTALDLNIEPVKLVNYPDNSFGALVLVTNPNKELAVYELNYSWFYYNSQGQQVAPLNNDATSGSTYILPQSKKYIMAPKINSSETISRAEFKIDGKVKWQKPVNLPLVTLQVSPAHTAQQLQPVVFTADSTIFNNSPYQISQVLLNFLVYDQTGKLSAISRRAENDLLPFERRAFKQLWPNVFLNFARVEILAETNLLAPSNLSIPKSTSNSSDLTRPENNRNW